MSFGVMFSKIRVNFFASVIKNDKNVTKLVDQSRIACCLSIIKILLSESCSTKMMCYHSAKINVVSAMYAVLPNIVEFFVLSQRFRHNTFFSTCFSESMYGTSCIAGIYNSYKCF